MKPTDVLTVIALVVLGFSLGYVVANKETLELKNQAVQKGAAFYHPGTGDFIWVDFYEMMTKQGSKG